MVSVKVSRGLSRGVADEHPSIRQKVKEGGATSMAVAPLRYTVFPLPPSIYQQPGVSEMNKHRPAHKSYLIPATDADSFIKITVGKDKWAQIGHVFCVWLPGRAREGI